MYFSPLKDPMAVGADAFLQDWNGLQAYAFLPFALIRQVLNKLKACQDMELALIAPFWSQKEWFSNLLNLSVAPPVAQPYRRDLLRQPHFHHLHQNLRVLHLLAWRTGDYSVIRQTFRFVHGCGVSTLPVSLKLFPSLLPASMVIL